MTDSRILLDESRQSLKGLCTRVAMVRLRPLWPESDSLEDGERDIIVVCNEVRLDDECLDEPCVLLEDVEGDGYLLGRQVEDLFDEGHFFPEEGCHCGVPLLVDED